MAERMRSSIVLACALAGCVCAPTATARAENGAVVGRGDEVARQFRTLLLDRDPAVQDELMRSLRSLRDATLAPLFTRLALCETPVLRAHAIVALSEVPAGKSVDLMLVRAQEPKLQAAVLRLALEAGIVEPAQWGDLARWPDLPEAVSLVIVARLPINDPAVAPAFLERVAAGEHTPRALAALALLDQRGGTRRLGDAGGRVAQLLAQNKHDEFSAALAMIVSSGWDAAVPALREWSARFSGDALAVNELAAATLRLDPDQRTAGREWLGLYRTASDEGDASRLQLGALVAASERRNGLPAAVVEALAGDSRESSAYVCRVLRALASAGPDEAVAATESAVMARCVPVVRWAEYVAATYAVPGGVGLGAGVLGPPEVAGPRVRRVLAGLLRGAEATGGDGALAGVHTGVSAETLARAARAAKMLAQDGPQGAAELARAGRAALERRDERLLRVVLDAALAGGSQACERMGEVCRLAGTVGEAGEGMAWASETRSLLALVRARARATHTPEEVDELTKLALGTGGLRSGQRVQAAWLVLRATGQDQAALALTVAGVEP